MHSSSLILKNTRSKELEPQDLLKAYHLREMDEVSSEDKKSIIETWERIKTDDLKELFEYNLFPAVLWYKRHDALKYTKTIFVMRDIIKVHTYIHNY